MWHQSVKSIKLSFIFIHFYLSHVVVIVFYWQWCFCNNEDNKSHDPILLHLTNYALNYHCCGWETMSGRNFTLSLHMGLLLMLKFTLKAFWKYLEFWIKPKALQMATDNICPLAFPSGVLVCSAFAVPQTTTACNRNGSPVDFPFLGDCVPSDRQNCIVIKTLNQIRTLSFCSQWRCWVSVYHDH